MTFADFIGMVDNAECDCDVRCAIENEQLDDERAEQHGAVCKIEKNRPQVSPVDSRAIAPCARRNPSKD